MIDIRELEERLLRPEIRQSPEELGRLLDDDFLEIGSSGRVYRKPQILQDLPDSDQVEHQITDFSIRQLSDDVILATYRLTRTQAGTTTNSLRSSLWMNSGNGWRMVFHQGTNEDPTAAGQ